MMKKVNNNSNANANNTVKENGTMKKQELVKALEIVTEAVKNGDIALEGLSINIEQKPKSWEVERAAKYDKEAQQIQRLINQGYTTAGIINETGLSRTTIRRRLEFHNAYKGNFKKYWNKLKENDRIAREAVAENVDNTSVEAADNAPAVTVEEPKANHFYLIDPYLIANYSTRLEFDKLLEKLDNQGATYAINSKRCLLKFANRFTRSVAEYAEKILNEGKIQVLDESAYLHEAAKAHGAIVITNYEVNLNLCKENGVNAVKFDDFMKPGNVETYQIDPDDEEAALWVKKLTIPVRLNNNKRIIANLDDVRSFARSTYGFDKPMVYVIDQNGNEKKTPTDEVRLVRGFFITIDGENNIRVILKVSVETEKDNAYEVFYGPKDKASAMVNPA